jgi:hypothetical protein
VFIELDCKQVMVDNISSKLIKSMLGAILDICKASLRFFQKIKISFIRGQINNIVHLIAMISLSYAGSHIHDYMLSCLCKKNLNFLFWLKKT